MKDIFRVHEPQLESIIRHYGEEHQKEKAEEEMAELIVAIRAEQGEDVAEEIADVYIMMAQMMLIYDIPLYLIDSLVKYKLDRTMYRITQEEKAVEKDTAALQAFEEKAADTAMAALRAFEEKNTMPHLSEKSMEGKRIHGVHVPEVVKTWCAAPSTIKEEKANGTDKEL